MASRTSWGAYPMTRSASAAASPGWPKYPAAADSRIKSGNMASTDENARLPAWLAL
ncbi:hypothetical protein D3C71_2181500 [compost metagenome]